MRTTPRTRSFPATSAHRASDCAAPSTCSWASATQIIQTFILNDDDAVREKAVGELFEAQTGDFLRHVQGNGRACRSSCACSIRRCTSSSRARARSTWKSRASRRRRRGQDPHRREAHAHGAHRRLRTSRTRCWACAVAVWASCTRASPRCRFAPSRLRPRSSRSEGLDPKPEIMIPLVAHRRRAREVARRRQEDHRGSGR